MFRFTIRDVLWLTVVVALAVGWWVQSRHTAGERVEVQRKLDDLVQLVEMDGYTVEFYKGSVGLSR